ncbi:MAG: hypothetical protein H6835_17520 [Planctomycetes bacterium]|nr:hypothetical protein [Planctomycetota bacterium]
MRRQRHRGTVGFRIGVCTVTCTRLCASRALATATFLRLRRDRGTNVRSDAGRKELDEVEAVADEGVDAVPEQRAVQAVLALRLRRRTVPHAPNGGRPGCATMRRRRYPWAELLRRVFAIDVLVCPHCGGVRRLLAAITAPDAIEKVLRAIGLPCEVAQVAPARAPPGEAEWWGA